MNIVCRPSELSGTVRAILSKSDAHRKRRFVTILRRRFTA